MGVTKHYIAKVQIKMKPTLIPLEFQILAVMGASEMTGRTIRTEYEKEFGQMNYGTLYTTLRRLRDVGFVHARDGNDGDGRVRLFTATENGRLAVERSRAFYRDLALVGLRNEP